MRWCVLISIMVAISGCSLSSFFYRHLDYYLLIQTKDVIPLSEQQEQEVEKVIDNVLAWHKKERLPQYIIFLNEYEQRLQDGFSSEDATWVRDLIPQEIALLSNKMSKDFALVSQSITAKQISKLQLFFIEKNEDYQDDVLELDKAEYFEEGQEDTIDSLEDWLGYLTDRQIKYIEQAILSTTDTRQLSLEYRRYKQQEWIKLLTEYSAQEKYSEAVVSLFIQRAMKLNQRIPVPSAAITGKYLLLKQSNADVISASIVEIMQIMEPEQKENLLEAIESYREQITDLIVD